MRSTGSRSVERAERHDILDALRGWALLGILIANMVMFIGFGFMTEEQRAAALGSGFDDLAELMIEWLIVGKFYSLFSLLFGIGFALQLERLKARGEGMARYVRRLAILFLFGLGHLYLLWLGDILALYALMGALLLLFRRASDRTLLVVAALLWLLAILWSALIHYGGVDLAGPIYQRAFSGFAAQGFDPQQGPMVFYRDSGFTEHFRAHSSEVFLRIGDFVYQLRPAKVLAMFLIGMWIGRHALYARLEESAPLLRRAAALGLGLGLPLSAIRAVLFMLSGDNEALRFPAELFYCLGTPTLAVGYAASFALLWRRGHRRALAWTAPAGRMALTNYIGQTIVQSVIFYGWGLGLMGSFGLVFVLPLSLVVFAAQVAFSRWWLTRYRFGPLEWLWRSGTYGALQPMRRAPPAVQPA